MLRFLRRKARLTQRGFGQLVGYSESQISRLEQGHRLPDPAAVALRDALISLVATPHARTAGSVSNQRCAAICDTVADSAAAGPKEVPAMTGPYRVTTPT